LPTPSEKPYGSSNNGCPGDGRKTYATARKASLWTRAAQAGGKLSVRFIEQMMGFPADWTRIE
jgi:hypothetical protein